MDRVFLDYYEEELQHIRSLATEFAALHPNVARNLSLDSVPCPDPYVERLLEGVAYLAAGHHATERYGVQALRYSILVLVVTATSWAAIHFLCAARTLRADMAAAAV